MDVFDLNEQIGLPLLVVSRIIHDMKAIREALTTRVPDGLKKWDLIDRLGPMESAGHVYVQRVGMTLEQAISVVDRFAVHSQIPEPLRTAHLIAGAVAEGHSRGAP